MFYMGQLTSARQQLENLLISWGKAFFGIFTSTRIVALSHLSLVLVISGYAEQARLRSVEAMSLAQELSHPASIAYVRSYLFMVYELCGDLQAASAEAKTYLLLSREQELSQFLGEATAFHGWALAESGHPMAGIRLILDGMAAMLATRMKLSIPYYRALLADAYARANRSKAERVRQLSRAIAQSERNRELWVNADLYRRRGEVLASGVDPDPIGAELDLRHAISVARSQGARLWELRAVTSLATLLRERGTRVEARNLLASTYGWFTEGFDTPDLKKAKALLDELA